VGKNLGPTLAIALPLLALLAVGTPAVAEEPPAAEPAPSAAQLPRDPAPGKSLTTINKALTDPVSEAWSIALIQNNFRLSPGPGEAERWNSTLAFQGAFPIALTPNWDLITRPFIELMRSQPHPAPGDPTEFERTTAFGDIVLLQLLSPRRQLVGNWVLGVGPTWIFPSGGSKWTSTGKWQVGPAAVAGYLSEKWILAALFQHWRSFGGSGPLELNTMELQPVAAYFLPDGWSVGYSGNILADWKARTTDAYTVPIGLQIAKVVRLGPIPVKLALAGQWMPIHPDSFGRVWNLQLVVQALRPKLLRGTLSEPSSLRFRWEE